jgi:hopanoid biosynthesis associated radical SAM protein HpnH
VKAAKAKGFRVNVNATLFGGVEPDRVAAFLDYATTELNVDGVSISPGYAYERAPDQEHFLNRQASKNLFRDVFRRGKERKGRAKWRFGQSTMFLDFLAGNRTYRCTPWGTPTRNVFGWQRPCYLLNEGYASSFKELMAETDWDSYGTGVYEKCADCMVHCGYEPTAVTDTVEKPFRALKTVLTGIRTEGPMAPEIPLSGQRPAEFVFERVVREALDDGRGRHERSRADHAT